MSITGSLVGYENNNDLCNKKNRSLLNVTGSSKQCASLNSSISNSVITTASSNISASKSNHQNSNNESMQQQKKHKHRFHLNSLWSIWYGILATYLQGYLVLHGAYRFLGCYLVQWRIEPPIIELNVQLLLCGVAMLLLPLFFISTIFKVGNLANDGIKLATAPGKCTAEPDDGLEQEAKGGTLRAIWTHGGPTSAFLHIVIAICLLVPRLLLESRLIENGNLPRENIWRTELDFMVTHRDRLVILSFMASPYQNTSNGGGSGGGGGGGEENDTKIDRTAFIENNDLSHTHLIEKFHAGNFDENDYFDTHEKLEAETVAPATIATTAFTSVPAIKTSMPKPNSIGSSSSSSSTTTTTTGQNAAETDGTRKRMKNRNNGGGGRREKANRKNADESNKKVDLVEDFGEERGTAFGGITKLPKKFGNSKEARIVDIVDEASIGGVTQRKTMPTKDSNIHIVKTVVDGIVPSTPISTDSKIIEIKPSTVGRHAKKQKRSAEAIPFRTDETILNGDDEDEDDDARPPPPRIYVNVDSDELAGTQTENTDPFFRNLRLADDVHLEGAEAAALIGSPVPINATAAAPVHLNGIAAYLNRYLNVNKAIDAKIWSSPPSFEFLNFVIAVIVWSARYPSVFWGTSKPFATIFSIQMIANGIDILLGFAGISVIYKLQIVGQQLPLQTPPFLLNGIVSLLLYILSILLIISSSLILYLYGHGRLSSRMRDRRMISTKTGDAWAYFAHCASLCFILALAVVKAPLMHDFSAVYRGSLDGAVLVAALASVMHIFFWIILWLGLTAKRRWNFKLPPLDYQPMMGTGAAQPLLMSPRPSRHNSHLGAHGENGGGGGGGGGGMIGGSIGEETIYWPKLTPSSPKLKVTFNDVPSTCSDNNLAEQDGKRNSSCRTSICLPAPPGETDDGDYATLRGPTGDLIHFGAITVSNNCDTADDTSEEGKLLECVRDDSVTYASTRDLEPPIPPPPPPPLDSDCDLYVNSADINIMANAMAPVTVTVHTNETHMISAHTHRTLRRGDSGMPHESHLASPRSESTSTECSTSPPERAPSDSSSSGVHSGEERDEVVIRPRQAKVIVKPPQPAIQEEPFGRSTNMRMSSFNADINQSSATLPINRVPIEMRHDYNNHCNTMPLPIGCHQQQYRTQQFITPNASKTQLTQLHTTLPNGVRYANPNYIRRVPLHVQTAESPYGILGLGAGHHTFSKHLHDPLMFNSIPEDRDSANYSMISEHDRDMYVNAGNIH